jgi:hypothetical protein
MFPGIRQNIISSQRTRYNGVGMGYSLTRVMK